MSHSMKSHYDEVALIPYMDGFGILKTSEENPIGIANWGRESATKPPHIIKWVCIRESSQRPPGRETNQNRLGVPLLKYTPY